MPQIARCRVDRVAGPASRSSVCQAASVAPRGVGGSESLRVGGEATASGGHLFYSQPFSTGRPR